MKERPHMAQAALSVAVLCAGLCLPRSVNAAGAPGDQELVLKMTVNSYRTEALVGTPIWVKVWISNETALRAQNDNVARRTRGKDPIAVPSATIAPKGKRWIDLIQFRFVRTATPRKPPLVVLSHTDWRDLIPQFQKRNEDAREVRTPPPRILWVIPPRIAAKLRAGHYRAEAVFDNRAAAGTGFQKVHLTSEPVKFKLRAAATKRDRSEVLREQASYQASYSRDLHGALALAKRAQTVDPTNECVHNTLAAIYWGQKRWTEALAEYRAYLKYLESPRGAHAKDRQVVIEGVRRHIRFIEKRLKGGRDPSG